MPLFARTARAILAATALTALTACKTEIEARLFATDLLTALGGQDTDAAITFALEVTSEDECRRNASLVEQAIAAQIAGATFRECRNTEEFTTFAIFDARAPVRAMAEGELPQNGLAVGVRRDTNGLRVSLLAAPDMAREIWDGLPQEMTILTSFQFQPVITLRFENDMRDAVEVVVSDAFANSRPLPGLTAVPVERRASLHLRLSDVANAGFAETGVATAFTLRGGS